MSDKEQKGIQVIGAGFPRTGTSSLQAALHILGYKPCHHMVSDVLSDVNGRGQRWIAAWDEPDKTTSHAMMKDILSDYQAVVDFPASLLVDDLIDIYPEAKVVLSVRSSPEVWHKSFTNTLDIMVNPWWYCATWLLPSTRFLILQIVPRWEALNKARFDALVYRAPNPKVYVKHNEWVRSIVPKDRLLEVEPGQGWQPLCEFLGKPIPSDPYPHEFASKENRKWFQIGAAMGVVLWVGLGAACVGVYYGVTMLLAKAQHSGPEL